MVAAPPVVITVFHYFCKRVGCHWEVWYCYADGHADPNGATEWCSVWGVRFWRWKTAERVVGALQSAYNGGMAEGTALDLLDGVHSP